MPRRPTPASLSRYTPDSSGGSRLPKQVTAILNLFDEPAACFEPTGASVWHNTAFVRLREQEPEWSRVQHDVAAAVRGLSARDAVRAFRDDGREPVGVLESDSLRGRYRIRALSLRPSQPGDRELIVVLVLPSSTLTSPETTGRTNRLAERHGLTRREQDVTELLLDGRSNVEIATALGISPHTARHHTERVLSKLGLRSRAAIWSALRDD